MYKTIILRLWSFHCTWSDIDHQFLLKLQKTADTSMYILVSVPILTLYSLYCTTDENSMLSPTSLYTNAIKMVYISKIIKFKLLSHPNIVSTLLRRGHGRCFSEKLYRLGVDVPVGGGIISELSLSISKLSLSKSCSYYQRSYFINRKIYGLKLLTMFFK